MMVGVFTRWVSKVNSSEGTSAVRKCPCTGGPMELRNFLEWMEGLPTRAGMNLG